MTPRVVRSGGEIIIAREGRSLNIITAWRRSLLVCIIRYWIYRSVFGYVLLLKPRMELDGCQMDNSEQFWKSDYCQLRAIKVRDITWQLLTAKKFSSQSSYQSSAQLTRTGTIAHVLSRPSKQPSPISTNESVHYSSYLLPILL